MAKPIVNGHNGIFPLIPRALLYYQGAASVAKS